MQTPNPQQQQQADIQVALSPLTPLMDFMGQNLRDPNGGNLTFRSVVVSVLLKTEQELTPQQKVEYYRMAKAIALNDTINIGTNALNSIVVAVVAATTPHVGGAFYENYFFSPERVHAVQAATEAASNNSSGYPDGTDGTDGTQEITVEGDLVATLKGSTDDLGQELGGDTSFNTKVVDHAKVSTNYVARGYAGSPDHHPV